MGGKGNKKTIGNREIAEYPAHGMMGGETRKGRQRLGQFFSVLFVVLKERRIYPGRSYS